MSTDREDRWGSDDDRSDRRRPSGGGDPVAGRAKAKTVGTALLLYGLFSLVLSLVSLGLYAASPETIAKPYHDMMKDMFKDAPRQPGQPDPVPPYEDFKKQMQVQNSIGAVVTSIGSVITILGGLKMRSASGKGLAMTGAILAMIPCFTGCCCVGLFVGIWAVVTLGNPDVKAAYEDGSRFAGDR
jgi:hypothetical protein